VIALADKIAAPIGHSLRGKEHIQYDNPFDVGMSGLLGYGARQAALEGADLLLMLGTDFPYDQFLPGGVRTAQVDIEATRLGRRTRMDLGVLGDVGETVRALLPLVEQAKSRQFVDSMVSRHAKAMSGVVGAYTKDVERHTPSTRVCGSDAGRGGFQGRCVHGGYGNVQRLGGAVHHPER
jgi:pyruvate dehydrogenase (quinone)